VKATILTTADARRLQ